MCYTRSFYCSLPRPPKHRLPVFEILSHAEVGSERSVRYFFTKFQKRVVLFTTVSTFKLQRLHQDSSIEVLFTLLKKSKSLHISDSTSFCPSMSTWLGHNSVFYHVGRSRGLTNPVLGEVKPSYI